MPGSFMRSVMRLKAIGSVVTVSEGKILLAVIRFMLSRKAVPYQVSVPTGRGIDSEAIKAEVRGLFENVNFKPDLFGSGPDIAALSETEWWLVECKGVGTGKAQTQRNNFDRALASVVTYYREKPTSVPDWATDASTFLGLALPKSPAYMNKLKRRVRAPLRKRLNLWVLLYDSATNSIQAISPDQDYE